MDPSASRADSDVGAPDSATGIAGSLGGGDLPTGAGAGGQRENPSTSEDAGLDAELARLKARNALLWDLNTACQDVLAFFDVSEEAFQHASIKLSQDADLNAKVQHNIANLSKVNEVRQKAGSILGDVGRIHAQHSVPVVAGNRSQEQQQTGNNDEQQAPLNINPSVILFEKQIGFMSEECARGLQSSPSLDIMNSFIRFKTAFQTDRYLDRNRAAEAKLAEACDATKRVFEPLERYLRNLEGGQDEKKEEDITDCYSQLPSWVRERLEKLDGSDKQKNGST